MDNIREVLKSTIKQLYNLDYEPDITPSPANIDADYSSNVALKLAKDLHKSPMIIAGEIEANFGTFESVRDNGSGIASEPRNDNATKRENLELVRDFERGGGVSQDEDGRERSGSKKPKISVTQPGFINFISPDEYLYAEIANLSTDFDKNISSDEYSGKTVICEFSDPNPFKVLHVGHLYTSVVGDAISRLYEYAGAKVIRANFGGDVGLHVAKTMYILQQKDTANLKIEDIAKCYVEGTAAYEDDESAKQEIVKLNKEIYKINAKDIHGTPLADLYWKGRELSYDYFKDFYAKINLKFDKYYPESTVAGLGLATVERELQNGVYEKSNGAVIFDGDKFGLHTRVFINKEGVPTYEAKDVGLIFTKWQDYHFDKSIVITGSEQLDYMKVVLKSVEQYAPELVERTTHLTHGLVKLPGNVKMSSRKGNFLKAVDVLELIDEALRQEFGTSDRKISLAATKYAFLKYKMGGNIVFDPKESVKMTGNSGPYLLYSAVRAKKILEKCNNITDIENYTYNTFEKNLIKKILEYKMILQEAVAELAPHKVAGFLYELAQEFSRFYEKCPVAGSSEEGERAKLVKVYLSVMTHGLNILGIEIPEAM